MNKLMTIARKEARELINNRSMFLFALGFSVFFGIFYTMMLSGQEGSAPIPLDNPIFFLSSVTGIFVAYILSGQTFLREKTDKVIGTLLCAPVNIRQIWLGKVIGVSACAEMITLVSVLGIVIFANFRPETLVIPTSFELVAHIVLVVPILVAAFIGLLGFLQFFLGMRENRILNFVVFVPLFALLYSVGYMMGESFAITWMHVGILLAAGLLLLLIVTYLVGRLSRERIVTTLP